MSGRGLSKPASNQRSVLDSARLTRFCLSLLVILMESSLPHQSSLTLRQFCEYVASTEWTSDQLLTWPPDVFAIAAALLLKSGAYAHAISGWTTRTLPENPQTRLSLNEWVNRINTIGKDWRENLTKPPTEIQAWHRLLVEKGNTPVSAISNDADLCEALLQLSAAADEACIGIGCTLAPSEENEFRVEASTRLQQTLRDLGFSTLCKKIDCSTVRVLPKLHTPRSGITIRSITHNLALCPAGDVKARWVECLSANRHCLNLLLAPWPLKVAPAHFQSVDPPCAELPDIADGFGFFEYIPPKDESSGLTHLWRAEEDKIFKRLKLMLENARKEVAKIDGVVFPELALTKPQYEKIKEALIAEGIFLICGVRDTSVTPNKGAQNYLQFDIPFPSGPMSIRQDKHHRWRLDKRQIVQYGLGSCLDVASEWWEHISIERREVYFLVLDNWLTICPLICEDLARQDPISELVRAIGPNLVIALLMDGPQLPSRWPARYATVLADDPGSSVLTLTSVGMAELSRPPSMTTTSRAVALWKDAKTGEAISIELPKGMEGVVLSLSREFVNEHAADGRADGFATGYPTLSGVHFVSSSLDNSH
jgi:hypothetical protein